MKLTLSLGTWRAAFLASLGLTLACNGDSGPITATGVTDFGGSETSDGGSEGSATSTTGGSASTGVNTGGSDSATGGSTGATTGGSTGATTGAALCEGAEDVLQWDGSPSGFIRCPDGSILREEAVTCSIEPMDDVVCDSTGICKSDADCTDKPGGQCVTDDFLGECGCVYPGCESDADCDEGRVCDCGVNGPVPYCIPAACVTNDDCAPYGCRLFDADPDCAQMQVACHGPDDLCYANSDCPDGQQCFIQEGIFQCAGGGCAIGRPFLVEGAARRARVSVGASDWRARDVSPRAGRRDAALAEHWAESARMEHASIAAFARFSLQLLSLGAPPQLLMETRQAIADETRHARQCFALASAFAGRALGPGALAVERALSDERLADIVELVILEGCVGETVAAIEAAEQRAHAQDPGVQRVLERIAADERRHAALAWRFVRWALRERGEQVRERVADCFARVGSELMTSREESLGARDRFALRQGSITEAARRSIRAAALREVVLPTYEALLLEQRRAA